MKPQGQKWFFALVVFLTLGLIVSETYAEEKQSTDGKVAMVNGSVITQEDFEGEMSRVREVFLRRGTPLSDSQIPKVKEEVLESLINRELLYQESQSRGIAVEEAAVNERFGALTKEFPSEVEFKKALSQMNLSEAAVKSQIRREMAIQQLIDEQFGGGVTVSDKESKAYYESHPNFFKRPEELRASHILIRVDPEADESQKAEARKEIEKIQKKLEEGEDFGALAKEFSQGPSAARGGDLNYFRRGQMVKPFEDVAFSLEPGEVSGIVETLHGYHLVKVTDKRPETTVPYEKAKDKIKEYLRRKKVHEETGRYVEQLKAEAEVKRFLEVKP